MEFLDRFHCRNENKAPTTLAAAANLCHLVPGSVLRVFLVVSESVEQSWELGAALGFHHHLKVRGNGPERVSSLLEVTELEEDRVGIQVPGNLPWSHSMLLGLHLFQCPESEASGEGVGQPCSSLPGLSPLMRVMVFPRNMPYAAYAYTMSGLYLGMPDGN